MAILDHIVMNNIRLIDYERIVDGDNNRLIAFGRFAGTAGAIDFLHGIGQFLKQSGLENRLESIKRCHEYGRLEEAKTDLYKVRDYILKEGGVFM